MGNKTLKLTQKQWFTIAVIMTFISVLIYELLTPMMSDDFVYQKIVNEAQGFFDLFRQEYDHYMNHIGRSVGHIVLRILMYTKSLPFAKTVLALIFTTMTILMYKLTQEADASTPSHRGVRTSGGCPKGPLAVDEVFPYTYILLVLLLWIFGVAFSDTVLWLTGACNYMVTTTIILANMLLYRRIYDCSTAQCASDTGDDSAVRGFCALRTAPLCLISLLAGWCNENTSGALILYALYLTWKIARIEKRKIPIPMIIGIIANIIGFVIMLASPGNASRLAAEEINSNIIVQMMARFFTVTGTVYNLFFPLLVVAVIIAVCLHYKGITLRQAEGFYLYLFLFIATSYSLMLVPQAQDRAFFGAGIFLFIALVRGLELLCVSDNTEMKSDSDTGDGSAVRIFCALRTAPLCRTILTCTLLLYMFFTYVDSSAKLIWIYRESAERMDYLAAQQAAGEEESGAPILRPQFETKYSSAYRMDIDEPFSYWVNEMYAEYYDLNLVWGVPREDWEEY